MNIWVLVLTIAGAVVYCVTTNSKATELARAAFWVGLFFVCYALASGRALLH